MGLFRLIILFALIWLAYSIYKRYQASSSNHSNDHSDVATQKMVMCEVCDVHIPLNEAIEENNHYFCSQEHVDIYHQ
jgi:uncharacterized protein